MQAIILAGGKGTRMGELTHSTPKPLLMIGSSPILAFSLASLPRQIDEVLIVTRYLEEQIISWLKMREFQMPIKTFHQPEFSGTGGAILAINESGKLKWPCLVINGDDLYAKDDLDELCQKGQREFVMQGFLRSGPLKASIKTERGLVTGFEDIEEQVPAIQCTGAYILHEPLIDFSPKTVKTRSNFEISLPHTLIGACNKATIKLETTKHWLRVGTPEELAHANMLYASGLIRPQGNIFTDSL